MWKQEDFSVILIDAIEISPEFNQVQMNIEIWIETIPHCSFPNYSAINIEVSLSIRAYYADMMGARVTLKQSKIFQLADLQSLREIESISN
mgnify:CR=1 FL=1